MSVESEILRIQHNIADTYAAVSAKGGEVPLQPNSDNLAAAVRSIPQGETAWEVYSEEEVRIGTWFGKPLYRKGYHMEVKTETGEPKFIVIDADFHGILTSAKGVLISRSWDSGYTLPYVEPSSSGFRHAYAFGYSFEENNHSLWISYRTIYAMTGELYVSIEYTKTTDEGSTT